jgi:hypothetical protein
VLNPAHTRTEALSCQRPTWFRIVQLGDQHCFYYFTVVAGALDHVEDVAVEVGVHDPRPGVLALQLVHLALQQRVVVAGHRVEALQAAVLVVVAGVRGLVQRQVDGEAAHRQHAGDNDVLGAQADQLVDALADGVHDGGALPARLLRGVPAEDLGVVVVAAELAEHEQGVGQVALAGCESKSTKCC